MLVSACQISLHGLLDADRYMTPGCDSNLVIEFRMPLKKNTSQLESREVSESTVWTVFKSFAGSEGPIGCGWFSHDVDERRVRQAREAQERQELGWEG